MPHVFPPLPSAKANELAEFARKEMMDAETPASGAAAAGGKPQRRASALAGMGVLSDVSFPPTHSLNAHPHISSNIFRLDLHTIREFMTCLYRACGLGCS
jgi:hypothetical protein